MSRAIFYLRVWWAFFVNAAIRELQFRSNVITTLITRGFWFVVQYVLFDLIYRQVPSINDWTRADYFGFMATGMLINSLVEAFFMPNMAEFSELIRTGNLDFALLKPVDTQFLVSFQKMDLAMISQLLMSLGLLGYAINESGHSVSFVAVGMYVLLVLSALAFFYSLMIALACTSIFFGRNQSLIEFWFYITIFARYPSSIYSGSPIGEVIRFVFSFVLPILLVVTVPARVLMGLVLDPSWLAALTILAGVLSLVVSRSVFLWSLKHYRSASS
ncbi:MAG TPA: ABC-2 family transporter protein [Planctomycetaceae bacterium]|nr:ABC-2 family transporter protein [Planctomycetaceae bacterium]